MQSFQTKTNKLQEGRLLFILYGTYFKLCRARIGKLNQYSVELVLTQTCLSAQFELTGKVAEWQRIREEFFFAQLLLIN